MAITQSFPKATPGLKDLLLGTKVEKDSIATRNFTVADIVDICKDYTFRPYKVFTALLTQRGGNSNVSAFFGDLLLIGRTYSIEGNDGNSADFTNVGAPNNNEYTRFIATGTTPNSWGINNEAELTYNEGAPVATVLENTIGNVWFTYSGIGVYGINSKNLFSDKIVIFTGARTSYWDSLTSIDSTNYSNNYFDLVSVSTTGNNPGDGILLNTPIEIRVYN